MPVNASNTTRFLPASYSDPAQNAAVVTPSDTTGQLTNLTRGLYIGGAGNIKVRMWGDGQTHQDVLFSGVPAGTILPICVDFVYSTTTTATLIVALW